MNIVGHRRARSVAIVSICIGALLLAACSAGGGHKRDSAGNMIPTPAELDPAGTLYAETVAQAEAGQCTDNTISILTCFSYRGHGYEGAQTALGQCMVHSGKTADGVVWLRRAADAGWPDAQKHMSELYAAGTGVAQSNVDALAWNNLYVKNPSLLSLGVEPDRTMSDRLRDATTADEKVAARQQSDAWSPTYWQPAEKLTGETAATCRVRMKKQRLNADPDTFVDPSAPGRAPGT